VIQDGEEIPRRFWRIAYRVDLSVGLHCPHLLHDDLPLRHGIVLHPPSSCSTVTTKVCLIENSYDKKRVDSRKGVFGNVIISENFLETFGERATKLQRFKRNCSWKVSRSPIGKHTRHDDLSLQFGLLRWRSQHDLDRRLAGKTEADPPGLYGYCDRCDHSDGLLECSSGEIVVALTFSPIRSWFVTDEHADDGWESGGWYVNEGYNQMSSNSVLASQRQGEQYGS
jgi:hypothetical protein